VAIIVNRTADAAVVTIDVVVGWHGLPAGAFVAMYSGWERASATPASFLNKDAKGTMHAPGPRTPRVLTKERDIVDVGVER
jgi:hypothetical protein